MELFSKANVFAHCATCSCSPHTHRDRAGESANLSVVRDTVSSLGEWVWSNFDTG